MSQVAYTITDSATMLRRELKRLRRYPSMTVLLVGMPVVFLLLFVYVFGGQLGTGLGGGHPVGHSSRNAYLNFIVPGILLMTVAAAANGRAVLVAMDMTEGIIARFRTMAISPTSMLNGYVVSALARTLVSAALVIAVSIGLGYRPTADAGRWLAAAGITVLLVLALTWLAVPFGLASKTAEGLTGFILIVQLLPFISSAFVPPADMSGSVRWFAAHEPFTPVIDTLRGLLTGGPIGSNGIAAVAWCAGLALAGYAWARVLSRRDINR
jgi:ABC-2 type transport system permease protein